MAENDGLSRKLNDTRRNNSPTAWVVCAVFFGALLCGLFFYDGRKGGPPTSGTGAPNVVTGASSTSVNK
jgi:hypothetical protein